MELKNYWVTTNKGNLSRLLQWVNLRPEEGERTWMMFAFYMTVSIGLRWAEDSTIALFLDKYGASKLPWIYIASAVLGSNLVFLYSWLQKIFPLRWVVVAIIPLMVAPLFLLLILHREVQVQFPSVAMIIIFLLKIWADAFYVVNDLNTSIVANQLFNIREIKRTYPIVSSGLLVADVLSGFSLPWLLQYMTLSKVILISCIVMIFGAGILLYLSYIYRSAFPYTPQRVIPEEQASRHRRLQAPLQRYAWHLFAFVALLQVIALLIDFQYLRELKSTLGEQELAGFLGLFSGMVGLCELVTQWFFSSRIIERIGVFLTAALLPITVGFLIPAIILFLHLFPSLQNQSFFWGLIALKFCDELLRYTFIISSGPALYQPIPERIRSRMQALSGGTAEAIASGLTGLVIFATLFISTKYLPEALQKWVLMAETIIIAAACLKVVWELRLRYVDLLVLSAERGQLSASNVGLRVFKQGVVKALAETGNEADKRSCLELLAQIDLPGAGEVLAPLLIKLTPDLQCQSLEVMLMSGANPLYVTQVRYLLERPSGTIEPEVFALALRYVWLAEPDSDLTLLEQYLQPRQNSLIRATAAALLLRQGNPMQKASATKTMRRMLTHKQEQERMNGVKALREAVYLQALRIHIPNLLQDASLRVRCAVLEMIAATHLEEYYSALLAALFYKSTRATAMRALVRLENEALKMLLELATDNYKPEVVRMYAWRTIAQIGTLEAREILWLELEKSWGITRDHIIRSLLKINVQSGNHNSLDRFFENRVEILIEQELKCLGEIYAAYIDLQIVDSLTITHVNDKLLMVSELLQRSFLELEMNIKERLLLLLKLLYPPEKMQAAAFNLRSPSVTNLARGLEILDHTVYLSCKPLLLTVLDQQSEQDKLQHLIDAKLVVYQKMSISDRLRNLLIQPKLLSDWCLACCFHFAQLAHISLKSEEILATLSHPTGFVREAAIAYLNVVSHRVFQEILPRLQKDPHPLVASQIKDLMQKYQEGNRKQ